MSEDIFISNKNPISDRWAIFEDDGISGWLYLTNPNDQKPITDCWIYNRIVAPSSSDIKNYKKGPPPASNEYAGPQSHVKSIIESQISLTWSKDGHAVALILDELPLGYVISGVKQGHCRNLMRKCPWGNVFDEEQYQTIFGKF